MTTQSLAESVQKAIEAINTMKPYLEELNRTVLVGWPFHDLPTEWEAEAIVSTFHELSIHQVNVDPIQHWRMAGHIIARLRRDVKIPHEQHTTR